MQTFYYAAKSRTGLEAVCESLQRRYNLPEFMIDGHDTWRYAVSDMDGLRFNVTKARDFHTIETWMPECPKGVNYQVIVECQDEPADLLPALTDALGTQPKLYLTSKAAM